MEWDDVLKGNAAIGVPKTWGSWGLIAGDGEIEIDSRRRLG